ncbi:hypothetical protein QYS50_16600 (plasmid) [Deinococcus altitudinis]
MDFVSPAERLNGRVILAQRILYVSEVDQAIGLSSRVVQVQPDPESLFKREQGFSGVAPVELCARQVVQSGGAQGQLLVTPAGLDTTDGRPQVLLRVFERAQIETDLAGEGFRFRLTDLMLQIGVVLARDFNGFQCFLQLGGVKQALTQKDVALRQRPAVVHQVGEPAVRSGGRHQLAGVGTHRIQHFLVKRVQLWVTFLSYPSKLVVTRFHQVSLPMFGST